MVALLLLLVSPAGALASGDDEHGHERENRTVFLVDDFMRHGVTVGTASAGIVDAGIELPAEIRPNADRLAHVAARFPGIVRRVEKRVGDTVEAGDVLAVVESDKLAPFELRAAFGGTVIDKHVVPGEAVSRDRPAFIIGDLSDVWVDIAVYQKALPAIEPGRAVLISTPDGTREAESTISYISPVVDQATRTATARAVLPNERGEWRPGTFAIAVVALDHEARVVVPLRALHTIDGRDVVFVEEGDTFVARPVRVGRVGRTRAEITSGLSPGERFADENAFLVKAELAKDADSGHVH